MDRTVTAKIDQSLCTGCGLCIAVCSHDTITLKDKKAYVTGDASLNCGHCAAACPVNAIDVKLIDRSLSEFQTFSGKSRWLPHGEFDIKSLVNLMQSRRTCRNYTDRTVSRTMLEDLVKIGISAPSGSNCQMWTFTILPDRKAVVNFGKHIGDFYKKLNNMAKRAWLRHLLRIFGQPQLAWYYNNYYQSVQEKLDQMEAGGKDFLFYGATAVIVVGSKNGASCPAEDALLATQNILLAAHSMGLGTCMVGFAVNALSRERKICGALNIPDDETPYAVIALGYPDEKYINIAGRKPVVMRYFEC